MENDAFLKAEAKSLIPPKHLREDDEQCPKCNCWGSEGTYECTEGGECTCHLSLEAAEAMAADMAYDYQRENRGDKK